MGKTFMNTNTHKQEVPLKRWMMERAEQERCSFGVVRNRFYEGHYDVQLRRVNQRVVFVITK